LHLCLVFVAQFVKCNGLLLAFLVELLTTLQTFLKIGLGSLANARFVLVRAHNYLVPEKQVRALAAEAPVTSSELATRSLRRIQAATIPAVTAAIRVIAAFQGLTSFGIAVECAFGLACKGGCIDGEGLSPNRIPRIGADRSNFVLHHLHGGKDLGEPAALKGGIHIVNHGMVR
jgi:hypothetical protein